MIDEARTTLFALSSGAPPAGVAVIRISGPQAPRALLAMTATALPSPRRAVLRAVLDPVSRETLDRAMVLWMPGPGTATGDDVVEYHLHGGRAVVAAVLAALARCDGLVPATAGAFTRRAFENGKLDLAQVEGFADLLQAETEAQRKAALALADGALGRRVEAWRGEVLKAAARIESQLDFGDEDDVARGETAVVLTDVVREVRQCLAAPDADKLRDGVRVAFAGRPNAGKSSLLNALVGREVAITSPTAGTTRDVIEAAVSMDGLPIVFIDTAGLRRDTSDPIEQEGIRRAMAAVARADIIVWMDEDVNPPTSAARVIRVTAFVDIRETGPVGDRYHVSSVTGIGLDHLRQAIVAEAQLLTGRGDATAINRRQRELIAAFLTALEGADAEHDLLIAAEHLRQARMCLDRLVGRAGVEDVLDTLFGQFCIGK